MAVHVSPRPRSRDATEARLRFAHAHKAPRRTPPRSGAAAIRSRSFGSLTYASSLPPHRNGLTAPPQFPSAPLLLIASPPRPVRFRSSSLRLPLRSSASSVAFLAHAHRSLTSGGALIGPVRGRHDGHDLPPSRPRPSTFPSVTASPFSKARVRAPVSPPARCPGPRLPHGPGRASRRGSAAPGSRSAAVSFRLHGNSPPLRYGSLLFRLAHAATLPLP